MAAADFGKHAVKLAGNLCGIPGLPVLADAVVATIETCESIPGKQRQNVKDLQRQCVALLEFLEAEASHGIPTSKSLEEVLHEASEIICGVDKRMNRWVKKNRWLMFLQSGSLDDDATSSASDIDRIISKLQLLIRSQGQSETKEIVKHMQTSIIAKDKQGVHFPQNVEDGYNVMKEMQQVYRNIDPSGEDDMTKLSNLRENILELQSEFGIILPDPILSDNEVKITSQYSAGGCGLYNLYPGTYLGKEVWCKKLLYGDPQGKAMMRFRRELDIWSRLWKKDQERRRTEGTPPRVLPLYGFYIQGEDIAYIVNAKPERGTLREVLRSGVELDPTKLIKGIAKALLLVHTMDPPVFHGDLNCTSIVVDDDWNPLLQDFRLSKTAFEVSGPAAVTHTVENHTPDGIEPIRWMAPETLNPRVCSTSSDIWSFGMVMYEILTRSDPYHGLSMFAVIARVANGETPNRPGTITNDDVWDLMKDCWRLKPTERPSIQSVSARLENL